MLILGVTSSTAAVGVAVARAGELVAERHALTERRHAEELTPMLGEILAQAGIRATDVDAFAVDVGPGRFTGLRVGLATVRALAVATDRPVVGVSSLELLAAGCDRRPVTAVVDARRNEVFQQSFAVDGPLDAPRVGNPELLVADLPTDTVAVGDGADRYVEVYGDLLDPDHHPRASVLVKLAAEREPVPGAEVEPLYLRDPDVQVNIRTRPT